MNSLPEMIIPEVHSYEQIYERARAKTAGRKLRAAFIAPTDPDMVKAVARAAAEGLIDPIPIGERCAFDAVCDSEKVSLKPQTFTQTHDIVASVAAAGKMAAGGEVDLIIKGKLLTSDLLKILFQPESRFRLPGRTVTHVAVLKPARYKKLLLLTDSAVVVLPDLKSKLELIGNLVKVAQSIGILNPRVALLAAVEVVYPQMPVTMEAAVISKMAERGQIKGAMVDGPLSFDVAVDMFAAHSKGVKNSLVAGQADAMVAPNIETANGVYKRWRCSGVVKWGALWSEARYRWQLDRDPIPRMESTIASCWRLWPPSRGCGSTRDSHVT
jgi:phosphotransacetylase